MRTHYKQLFAISSAIASLIAFTALPLAAQPSNFGKLTLAAGFRAGEAQMKGKTGGSYSLSSISNRDRHNNLCLGFGTATPDHILELQADFSELTIRANSRNNTILLLVQGPDHTIRCGEGSITDKGWRSGTYRVWVASAEPGLEHNYSLSIQQK